MHVDPHVHLTAGYTVCVTLSQHHDIELANRTDTEMSRVKYKQSDDGKT